LLHRDVLAVTESRSLKTHLLKISIEASDEKTRKLAKKTTVFVGLIDARSLPNKTPAAALNLVAVSQTNNKILDNN